MEESNDKSHSHLLDLPVELIELIAESIPQDSPSLLDFRLTCRDICAGTQSAFETRYFTDRSFLIRDEASLAVLRKISEHERYVKCMRRIHFSMATILGQVGDSFWRRREVEKTCGRDVFYTPDRTERSRLREYRREHSKLLEAANEFHSSEADRLCLKVIFANFLDAGNCPAIAATGKDTDELIWYLGNESIPASHQSTWGYKRLCRLLGYSKCLAVDHEAEITAYWDICDAIFSTGFLVPSLDLGSKSENGVMFRTCACTYNTKAFANLTSLKLTIAADDEIMSTPMDERDEMLFALYMEFRCFLLDAVKLEYLSLTADKLGGFGSRDLLNIHATVFTGVFLALVEPGKGRPAGFQHLRSLELIGQHVRFVELVEFVQKKQDTLRYLRLENVHEFEENPEKAGEKLRRAHGGDDFQLEMEDSLYTQEEGRAMMI